MLTGQASPAITFAQDDTSVLMQPASMEDVQKIQECISDTGVQSFVAQNLLLKGFSLTNYEMLIMSELVKQEIQKAGDSDQNIQKINELVELQNKYIDDYAELFNHEPQGVVKANKTVEKEKEQSNNPFGKFAATSGAQETPTATGSAPTTTSNTSYVPQPTFDQAKIKEMAAKYGINIGESEAKDAAQDAEDYQNDFASAGSGEDLNEAMSLINIRTKAFKNNPNYRYENPINPILDLNDEKLQMGERITETDYESEDYKAHIRSIQELIDKAADIEDKKIKHFFLTFAHSLYYLDSGTEGNAALDTSIRDDNGNLYQIAVEDEHEVQEALEIGFGTRIFRAIDLIVSVVAENENGTLGQDGTSWDFGNVFFKFHPERMTKGLKARMDSEGIIIDGNRVGKRLGHSTTITTDTEDNTTTLNMDGTTLNYDRDEGFQFSTDDARYYLGFGKMSLNFSTYTLQLSDCKAVKVGYHDRDQELVLLYGRPNSESEGYTGDDGKAYAGTFQKDLFAAQYITKNFIPDMTLTFNFAKGMDKGELTTPNGANKETTSVYSIMMQGTAGKTSYDGEFARLTNNIRTDNGWTKITSNADYLDLNHSFSDNLNASLHVVNIDGTYDNSALVEDNTGEYLLSTSSGDGTPDYLYQPGQRGLDLTLDYTINSDTSMAFGYSRYSETTSGNSKTEFYLSGAKQWSLGDGTVSLQQRFGSNKVSNRTYTNKTSSTTLSYSGAPWENGTVSADWQRTLDKEEGNEVRYDLTVAHEFAPVERVTITPKFQYERKLGDAGEYSSYSDMDTTTIIHSVTIGYELIPDELTVNFLVSKEKYDIIQSEIDEATGKKVDGERRNTLGVGLGLSWEPKKIAGLTLGLSYRRDKVDYLDLSDNSNQDVWEYSLEYTVPVSQKIRASISYDYKSAKDKLKPIYDDVTRNISIDIDAQIGRHSSLQLQHEYESEYKPLDASATSTTHTTTFQMVNRF